MHERRRQLRQPQLLRAIRVEVVFGEPAQIRIVEAAVPISVDDGKPAGVAIAAFVDDGLSKQTFVGEAEARVCAT